MSLLSRDLYLFYFCQNNYQFDENVDTSNAKNGCINDSYDGGDGEVIATTKTNHVRQLSQSILFAPSGNNVDQFFMTN